MLTVIVLIIVIYILFLTYTKNRIILDSIVFAEILLQRPFKIGESPSSIKTKLTDEDITYMSQQAKEHFNVIMTTLKEMPRNIIFVIRNLNTIRAIAREHGDVVDRLKLMARSALSGLKYQHTGFFGYFTYLKRKLFFEFRLL